MNKVGRFVIYNVAWVTVSGIIVLSAIFIPHFFTTRNLINIIYHSSALGMLVLAESLCLLCGKFDLSIESTLAMSVAIPGLLMVTWASSISPYVGIGLTVLIGSLIGLTNGFFIVKLRIDPFLMTLSMLIMLRGLLLYVVPKTLYGLPQKYTFLGGWFIGGYIPLPAFVLFGVYLFFHFLLKYVKFGREIYATGGNEEAAFTAGINTDGIVMSVYVLSGVLAAIAGWIMAGRLEAITNYMGEGMVFLAFAGAILGGVSLKGGIGTVLGAFSGILLLGVIDNVLRLTYVSPYLTYAVKGFLIFIAINIDNLKSKLS